MSNRWLRSIGACVLVLGCHAAAPTEPPTEPQREPQTKAEPEVAEPEHGEPLAGSLGEPSERDPAPASGSTSPAAPARATPAKGTGIAVCDEYIALYERCEPLLRAEIMAGDRRPPHAERGWLEHLASTPERASLPDACQGMLAELRPRCPVPEPVGVSR